MGQIKNIKLHIVTDIKPTEVVHLATDIVSKETFILLKSIIWQGPISMNGHLDSKDMDVLSGSPAPLNSLPRIPKKKKEGDAVEIKEEPEDDDDAPQNGVDSNGVDSSPDVKLKTEIKEEDMDSDDEVLATKAVQEKDEKSNKRKADDDGDWNDENDGEHKKKKKKKDKKKSKEKDKGKGKEEKSKSKAKTKVKKEEEEEDVKPKKKKVKEEEEEVWRWWEETPHEEGVKWKTLEHNGPFFPPL